MADLRFQYKDGQIVSAVIDFEGPNDFRVGLSGIDKTEAAKLQEAFKHVDPAQLDLLQRTMQDGITTFEEYGIRNEIRRAMTDAGVSGVVTYVDGDYTYSQVFAGGPVKTDGGAVKNPDRAPTELEKEFQDAFEAATGAKVSGLDISRNSITFSADGKQLHLSLAGLSEEEAQKLETYLLQDPDLAKSFTSMLQSVGEDLKVTDAERELVNNNTEQLMIGAGVSADVVPGSIAASPIPGMKR